MSSMNRLNEDSIALASVHQRMKQAVSSDNIRLVIRNYVPKFEGFWISYKRQKVILLRGLKTYGSPFISL
jgi:hypothetical protein